MDLNVYGSVRVCNEKLQRQDMEKHVEEKTQKHLALMAAASMKLSQEFERSF